MILFWELAARRFSTLARRRCYDMRPMTDAKPIEIYVDADACPVKAEIYRVAERHILKGDGLRVYVVSNSPIAVPREPWIERVVVGAGMDAADDWIAERAGRDDVVVTA